jgi:hypothetical protein
MECINCGCYIPKTLGGQQLECGCDRTKPLGDLPYMVCICPKCGGVAPGRYGCWGNERKPHEHCYMVPSYELVKELNG